VNGKDWNLRGFLSAERGSLKLSFADDAGTQADLSHAALRFCKRPVKELRRKRWDADQLNALLAPVWTCRGSVPLQVLVQATLRSKAMGLFQPRAD